MAVQKVQKYITKNDKTGAIGAKFHTNTNCTAIIGLRLITAPDSLLRHYGITEQCKLCEKMTNKPVEDESDIKRYMPLLSNSAKVISKQLSRGILRSFCLEYQLPFTLRSTKPKLARSVVRYWIRNGQFDNISRVTQEALVHWTNRIEVNDRHMPYYYEEMKERCEYVLKLVKEVSK